MGRTSLWVPVLAFQILMFFAKESLAFQCYKCSYDGTYCNDPFNPNLYGVTKCDGRSACIKTTTYDSGIQMTTRSCFSGVIEVPYCEDTITFGTHFRTCYCNKDLCNKSSEFGSFTGLLLFLSIASLAFLLKLQ